MKYAKKALFLPIITALIAVSCKKNLPPVISLNGEHSVDNTLNAVYQEAGATAKDVNGKDVSDKISTTGAVNINKTGTYQVFYDVTDKNGNKAVTATRVVKVINSVEYLQGYYNISYNLSGTSTYSGTTLDEINVSNTVNKRFYLETPFSFYAEVGDNGLINVPFQGGFNNQLQGSGQLQTNGIGQINLQSQAYGNVSIQFVPQ